MSDEIPTDIIPAAKNHHKLVKKLIIKLFFDLLCSGMRLIVNYADVCSSSLITLRILPFIDLYSYSSK